MSAADDGDGYSDIDDELNIEAAIATADASATAGEEPDDELTVAKALQQDPVIVELETFLDERLWVR